MDETERLAALIGQRNAVDDEIAHIIGRPAQIGHVGEWLAQAAFDVKLEHSATQAGYDGHFAAGPLAGKTVNVKWYGKREGILDINLTHGADYYLVFAGPKTAAMSSRGTTRPWVIAEVFLFDMPSLITRLKTRGVRLGVATSVRQIEWEAARIYPEPSQQAFLRPTAEQVRLLSLFGPT